ncbi:MAG: MarR family winged helix-turn-helix transcriptional regulator [Rhodanobacter sp.]
MDADSTSPPLPARVRHQASWLLGQAARRGRRMARAQLAAHQLGLLDYLVLATLAEHGGRSQAELVRMLPVDGSDMVAILGQLERLELVERRRDPLDARRKLVELTATGRRRQARFDALLVQANDALLAPLTHQERAVLLRLLAKIVEA